LEREPKLILHQPRQLEEGFDPGRELWERLVDDAVERGGPCLATVENLVDQACRLPANPRKRDGEEPDRE
jgi:hypothetical protein